MGRHVKRKEGRKKNFLQYEVLEICLSSCLTAGTYSDSSKPQMEEEELEVSCL